jgi:endoglucanase
MASGGNDIGHIDTDPKQEAYVLYGGVIGGPDKTDQFYDIRSDWPETEVGNEFILLWCLTNFFLTDSTGL